MDQRIRELQQEGSLEYNGVMAWPYPGDGAVYSAYGMRFHPSDGEYKMHSGVDLGGNTGNPIVAAESGTVLSVVTPCPGQKDGGSGYGNYLIVGHDNGISTLYAHCKDVYVSVGQSVGRGETIASCGSTGMSTGPHLHFEVRENGTKVNPMKYIG